MICDLTWGIKLGLDLGLDCLKLGHDLGLGTCLDLVLNLGHSSLNLGQPVMT